MCSNLACRSGGMEPKAHTRNKFALSVKASRYKEIDEAVESISKGTGG